MKRIFKLSAGLLLVFWSAFTLKGIAQTDQPGQSKSYVKIRTMKIINGDTIVSEKEYTGNGNMGIQDSLAGQGFSDFKFGTTYNNIDSSLLKKFSDMQEVFKNFDFNNMAEFPGFNGAFNIDSITKEFNFQGFDAPLPLPGKNEFIFKSFKDTIINNDKDKIEKSIPDANMHFDGKENQGKELNYSKRITVLENGLGNDNRSADKALQIYIFPNPANELFNLSFQLDPKKKAIISLLDVNGKQLQKETIEKAEGTYTRQFDMKAFENGTYIINVKQRRKSISRKILVE